MLIARGVLVRVKLLAVLLIISLIATSCVEDAVVKLTFANGLVLHFDVPDLDSTNMYAPSMTIVSYPVNPSYPTNLTLDFTSVRWPYAANGKTQWHGQKNNWVISMAVCYTATSGCPPFSTWRDVLSQSPITLASDAPYSYNLIFVNIPSIGCNSCKYLLPNGGQPVFAERVPPDSDGDGYDDEMEIFECSDPLDPMSIPCPRIQQIGSDTAEIKTVLGETANKVTALEKSLEQFQNNTGDVIVKEEVAELQTAIESQLDLSKIGIESIDQTTTDIKSIVNGTASNIHDLKNGIEYLNEEAENMVGQKTHELQIAIENFQNSSEARFNFVEEQIEGMNAFLRELDDTIREIHETVLKIKKKMKKIG